jgi:iron complex transport system substrate-binding protein
LHLLNMSDDGEGQNKAEIRIVSLLPSITEIIASLGVADQIVGITHECDFPPEAIAGAKVVTTSEINPHTMTQEEIHNAVCGSIKNGHSLYGIDKDALQSVRADMVFTQQLCDVCAVSYPIVLETCAQIVAGPPALDSEGGEALAACSLQDKTLYPKVISMEPTNLNDVLKTILVAGKALGPKTEKRALDKIEELEEGFDMIRAAVKGRSKPNVAFMEWHDPVFSGGHWIPDMMEAAGAQYEMCKSGGRSVPFTDDEFIKLDPDIILVGPCGFDLQRTLADTMLMYKNKSWWKDMRAVKAGNVYALDGNSYYARPGPRLLQGCGIMAACIHGKDVAKELGEDLAPSSGYCRVSMDMYNE